METHNIKDIKPKEEAGQLENEHRDQEHLIDAENTAKKRKKIIAITASIAAAFIAFLFVLTTVIIPNQKLNKAKELLASGEYEAAYVILEEIGKRDVIVSNKYDRAMALIDSGEYDAAYALLEEIGNRDAIVTSEYNRAMVLIDSGEYDAAYAILEKIGKQDVIVSNKYDRAMALIDSGEYDAAYAILEEIGKRDAIALSELDRAIAVIDAGGYRAGYKLLEELRNNAAVASKRYDKALEYIDSGKYEAAYALLKDFNYQDSNSKRNSIMPQYLKAISSTAQISHYIFFGSYEQDNNTSNGKEDIEWRILARDGEKLLVISRYALDVQPYDTTQEEDISWETSSLREWLNGTFFNNAFCTEEQDLIQSVTITEDDDQSSSTSPGTDINDKVFLLSISEANKYFVDTDFPHFCIRDTKRELWCKGTAYCLAQGAKNIDDYCWWWLRSPSTSAPDWWKPQNGPFTPMRSHAALVAVRGVIDTPGLYGDDFVNSDPYAIRPVLWIDPGPSEGTGNIGDSVENKMDRATMLYFSNDSEAANKLYDEIGTGDVIKAIKYYRALEYIENSNYEAIGLLWDLNYKDSERWLDEIFPFRNQ